MQQLGYNNPGQQIGVLGISDGVGGYVYYPDYTTAMAAAKSGDTIVQFADIVEYRQITIILKNGVNINMNGFTYELKATKDIAAFQDRLTSGGTGGVTMSLMNGTIKCTPRQAFVLGAANPMCLFLQFSSGNNITTNCNFVGIVWSIMDTGTLTGGVISGTNSGLLVDNGGTYNNITSTQGALRASSPNTVYANNCVFNSTNGSNPALYLNAQYSAGIVVNNCVVISSGHYALRTYFGNGGIRLNNSVFISTASICYEGSNQGLSSSSNCVFISTANFGIYGLYAYTSNFNNVFVYSSSNNAVNACALVTFNNSTFISTATAVVDSTSTSNTFINSIVDCQWNNPLGHAVQNATSVIKCYLKVANVRAKCLNATTARNMTYLKNTYQGANEPVSGNVIQAQNNTRDLYGNITIG